MNIVLYNILDTCLLIISFILGEKIKHKKVTCVEGKCKAQNRNIIDACSYICGNPTCDYISKNSMFFLKINLNFSSMLYFFMLQQQQQPQQQLCQVIYDIEHLLD